MHNLLKSNFEKLATNVTEDIQSNELKLLTALIDSYQLHDEATRSEGKDGHVGTTTKCHY